MLSIKFQLTVEEYFQYNYFTAWADPQRKQYRLLYYVKVLLLYAVVAALYLFANRNHSIWTDLGIFALIAFLYLLMVPWLIRKSVRRKVKQILSQKENAHILDLCEVQVSEQGIMDKDSDSESFYKWEAIVKKAETLHSYYLYTNSYHAIVIPKRALTSDHQRQQLKEMLSSYLSLSAEFSA